MDSDSNEILYGLIALAKEQQQAVKEAVSQLAVERGVLALEVARVGKVARQAVVDGMAEISGQAGEALKEATRPAVARLQGVVEAAGQAEGKLGAAVAAFGWRWALLAAGAAAGGILAVVAAAWITVGWQRQEVDELRVQRQALQAEVAQLQETVAELEKRGGRIVMTTCGGRLCVAASRNQGAGADNWEGAVWHAADGRNDPLVIPKGY